VTIVFAGTILEVPPFSSVIALNDRIKIYWENQNVQAPYPHAEISTLTDFSERTGISLEKLQERFATTGIAVKDPSTQTIADLARVANLSPNELFGRISESQGFKGGGAGLGQQTLPKLCESLGIPLDHALNTLKEHGFTVETGSTLRNLAQQKGMSPMEVRDLLMDINE
jgi:hypothetical protein